jgi:hypothetical protein
MICTLLTLLLILSAIISLIDKISDLLKPKLHRQICDIVIYYMRECKKLSGNPSYVGEDWRKVNDIRRKLSCDLMCQKELIDLLVKWYNEYKSLKTLGNLYRVIK